MKPKFTLKSPRHALFYHRTPKHIMALMVENLAQHIHGDEWINLVESIHRSLHKTGAVQDPPNYPGEHVTDAERFGIG